MAISFETGVSGNSTAVHFRDGKGIIHIKNASGLTAYAEASSDGGENFARDTTAITGNTPHAIDNGGVPCMTRLAVTAGSCDVLTLPAKTV